MIASMPRASAHEARAAAPSMRPLAGPGARAPSLRAGPPAGRPNSIAPTAPPDLPAPPTAFAPPVQASGQAATEPVASAPARARPTSAPASGVPLRAATEDRAPAAPMPRSAPAVPVLEAAREPSGPERRSGVVASNTSVAFPRDGVAPATAVTGSATRRRPAARAPHSASRLDEAAALPPPPPAQPSEETPRLSIGSIEVRVTQPPAPTTPPQPAVPALAPVASAPRAPTPIARVYASRFGLAQG